MKYSYDGPFLTVYVATIALIMSTSIYDGFIANTLSKVFLAAAINFFFAGVTVVLMLLSRSGAACLLIIFALSTVSLLAQRACGITDTLITLLYAFCIGIGVILLRRSGHFDRFA